MGYFLTTEAMRVVERNDKGNVTYRKRYRKGDEVDTSHMDEAHVENLVAKGTLVESEDDVPEGQDAGDISPVSGPFGAAAAHQDGTTPAAPPVEPVQDDGSVAANTLTPSNPESQIEPPAPSGDDEDDVEEVDQYSDMDYADLQQTAKSRGLNAGGSAEDLRTRLREDDDA